MLNSFSIVYLLNSISSSNLKIALLGKVILVVCFFFFFLFITLNMLCSLFWPTECLLKSQVVVL